MARPIDEKIVAMKMDNSDFKRKALETTSLFGRLRDSLNRIPGINLGKTVNDLNGIQRAANSTDLSIMSRSLDTISSKFSALNVMATTALVNIANRAVNTGLALTRSLGPDQVADGFREYEMKIGSIGTMLANTKHDGSTLEDVKKTLNELNDYADQTIYNFGQMTQNIGRFTSAGVGLQDSATAIKGLGNLAAISGSTSEQLNSAMYQMSQAMSQQNIMAIDWISLTNAGMGGKVMQDALLKNAKALGVNVDLTKGFKGSLEKGWLTTDIFLQTLKEFGEDESMIEAATKVRTFTGMMSSLKEGIGSGWAETWELVFGDFEEATLLWSTLKSIIEQPFNKAADTRNNFLRSIIEDGHVIEPLFTGISNAAKPVIQIFKAMGEGFKMAFPPMGVSGIEKLSEGFKNLTSGMAFSSKTVQNIKTIFAGFFSVFAIGWDIIQGAVSIILALIPSFSGLGSKIVELIARVAQIPIAFNNASDSGKSFGSAMEFLKKIASNVSTALEFIVDGLISFVDTVAMAFGVLSSGEVSDGPWKDTKIVDWLVKVRDGFSSFSDAVGSINWSAIGASFVNFFKSIKTGFEWIIDKASAVGEAIKNAIPDGNQVMAGGFIAGLVAMVGMAIKMAWDLYEVFTGWGKIGAGVAETLEGVGGALESFAWQVKAQALLTIAIAVGILAVSFYALAKIGYKDLTKGLYAIIGGLTAVVTAMAIMTKYDITGTGLSAAVQIVALSVAFAILAGALNKMKDMKWEELAKGLTGLIGIMATFSLAMIAMSKFSGPKVAASALQFVGLAVAMHILISAIEKIADINPGTIVKGVSTLGTILVALGVFLAISSKSKFGAASAVGILGISAALLIIVKAVEGLGKMNVNVLKQGLLTITIILAAISAFSLIGGNMLVAGAGIMLLSVAMNLLMVPILALGSMDLKTLAIGIGAMAVALLAIGAASLLMTGAIAAGAGLILIAAGLNMLLVPIMVLSAMSWKALAVGIGGLAIGILAIGGAAALLGLAAPALLLGALGIAAIGVAMLAAGAGISLFGAGLVTLAGMTGTAVTTIVAMLGTLIMGLVSLIPKFVDFMSALAIKVLDALIEYTPIIINKVYDLLIKILGVIAERVPDYAKAATDLITAFLDAMAEELPRIVMSATNLMVATVEALATAVETNGPRFTDAFSRLMAEIAIIMVDAGIVMINALFGWIPGVQDATNQIATTAEAYIRDTFDADGVGSEKGEDFNNALASKAGNAQVAGEALAKNSESGVNTAQLGTLGGDQGAAFASGISSKSSAANTAGTTLATSGRTGAGSVDLTSTGENTALGFVNGIGSSSMLSKVASAASSLAKAAYNRIVKDMGIHSPADATDELGGHTGQGYANGIKSKTGETSKSANSLMGVVMNALGIKSPVTKEASKGGKVAGESYAKGVQSTKKSSEKAGKDSGKSLAKGLKDSKKDAEKAAKEAAEAVKKAFKEEMDTADFKFEMEEIDHKQYIAELERIKKAYSKYTDLFREVSLKIKKEREQQEKDIAEAFKKRMDAEKKAIDDKKYHNNLSLMQELALWQKVLNQYKKGTEERSQADREVFRIKNEINNKLLQLNDDYISKVDEANQKLIDGERELREELENTIKSKSDSLAKFTGLFDKVDEMVTVSSQELIDNLKGQNRLFDEWSTNIFALGNKGIDPAMLAELREMGPKSAAEIKAINSMTSEQLTIYVNEWKKKQEMARVEATRELEQLKKDTETKIKELHAQTAKQLAEYQKEWIKNVNEIKNWTKEGFVGLNTSMKTIGEDTIKGLMSGISKMEGPVMKQAKGIADNIAATIRKALQVKSPSRVTEGIGEFAGEGLANGIANKAKAVAISSKNLAMTARDSLNDFINGFELDKGDNELHFKAVIDYDTIDPKQLGSIPSMRVQPDMSFANSIIAATKASFRQNDNNFPKDSSNNSKPNTETQDNQTKQPIVLQIPLNGRVIAEETYEDVSQLIGDRTNLNYAMR